MLQRIHGIEVRLDLDGAGTATGAPRRRDPDIAEEALHNAVATAERTASACGCEWRGRDDVEVVDDGRGFDPGDPELRFRHLGLTSMDERARELGARLAVESGRAPAPRPARGAVR